MHYMCTSHSSESVIKNDQFRRINAKIHLEFIHGIYNSTDYPPLDGVINLKIRAINYVSRTNDVQLKKYTRWRMRRYLALVQTSISLLHVFYLKAPILYKNCMNKHFQKFHHSYIAQTSANTLEWPMSPPRSTKKVTSHSEIARRSVLRVEINQRGWT